MTDMQKNIESLSRYRNTALGVIIALVVGFGIYSFIEYQKESKEQEITSKFYSLEKAFAEKRKLYLESEAQKPDDKNPAPAPKVTKSGDLDRDYGDVLKPIAEFADKNKETRSATVALAILAEIYGEYKKLGEIAPLADQVAKAQPANTFASAMSQMIAGNAFAEKQQCDPAIENWEKIIKNDKAKAFHGEAALRAGLCFEMKNDLARAQEMYRKASQSSKPGSSTATLAEQYLRAAGTTGAVKL